MEQFPRIAAVDDAINGDMMDNQRTDQLEDADRHKTTFATEWLQESPSGIFVFRGQLQQTY